jgi:hypothetical protein
MDSRIEDKRTRLQTDLAAVRAKIAEFQQLEQRMIGALLMLDELQSESNESVDSSQEMTS